MAEYSSETIHCPRCGSEDVDCTINPHRHTCYSCGYDGTAERPVSVSPTEPETETTDD